MLQFDDETTKLLEVAYQGGDVRMRRRRAFDALDLVTGDVVLDVGCGHGFLLEEMARTVGESGRVIGVDPSADMRAAAMARCEAVPQIEIHDGLADDLPLEDGAVDKAVSVQVLEYLPDLPAAMAEVHRVLRPGGRFVAIDTGFDTLDWFTEDADRMARIVAAWDHHYTEARVGALWPGLAREAGFGQITVEPLPICDITLRPDGLANMALHLMSRYAAQNGHVPEEEAQAWMAEQVELARQGRFFFSLTYFCMSAVKL